MLLVAPAAQDDDPRDDDAQVDHLMASTTTPSAFALLPPLGFSPSSRCRVPVSAVFPPAGDEELVDDDGHACHTSSVAPLGFRPSSSAGCPQCRMQVVCATTFLMPGCLLLLLWLLELPAFLVNFALLVRWLRRTPCALRTVLPKVKFHVLVLPCAGSRAGFRDVGVVLQTSFLLVGVASPLQGSGLGKLLILVLRRGLML